MTSASSFRDKFAIVGLGITKQGHFPDISARTWEAEAARLAIQDAGLRREDIDGTIHSLQAGGVGSQADWDHEFPLVLGLPVKFHTRVARAASTHVSILIATQALDLGVAKYVLVARGLENWTIAHKTVERGLISKGKSIWGLELGDIQPVVHHIFLAKRHMYEYGTTSRQLGAIAVAERSWACLNPDAYFYGRPITIEDYLNSPITVWPYHKLDMTHITDGGEAFIVTTAERAKDLRKPPVYIMGLGFGEMAGKLWWEKANYTQLAVETAKTNAFRLAGIGLKDIDVAQLYDCFTGEVLLQLEDYGWCRKGEGGPFVEAGNIGPGGTIPVNTGGGLLSSHGQGDFTPLGEAVIQLRGEGEARQVKDAEIAISTGHGGELVRPGMCSAHGTLILRR